VVNGQTFSGTGYQLDGTDNRDPILGSSSSTRTSRRSARRRSPRRTTTAEFGQAIAGVVSVQTKSGTNEFHGSAFEYLQRDSLQARNPFTQPDRPDPVTGRVLPKTVRDQFGGSLGGPIVKNNWFFFADYQGTRSEIGGSQRLTVPTALARTGDLSEYGVDIFDPAGGAPANRTQFPGNVIPSNRLSPAGARHPEPAPQPHRARPPRQLHRAGIRDVQQR
jgi:hypothetical protein